MDINTSPDITQLNAQVTWDISGTLPAINLVNLSIGPNLAGITWWVVAFSPTGTLIHAGDFSNPDAVGIWTTLSITDSWPRPFNQIEFSGAPYILTLYIQDSQGNQYNTGPYQATICRPSGNTPTSKTFYGTSKTEVIVKCQQARISFQDLTNHTYRGLDGTLVSSVLRVVYPIDETGNIPTPFVLNNFSFALVPISYSSDQYQFQTQSVYDYDFGNYVHVRIRYQTLSKNQASYMSFPVLCNIDLGVLACEYAKLVDTLENGSCSDVQETQRKMLLINPKFSMAQLGISYPLTGIDVPELIEQIKRIGGFDCDCCNAPTGIIPNTTSVIDGYSFSIVGVGGDVGGDVTTTGTNIQFNLHDKSYVFNMCPSVPTTAFTVTPSTSGDGFTKTYCLNVDLTILSTDLLNTIKDNGTLVNLFNSIVIQGGNIELTVDGGCIFQSTSAFNYTFDLTNIPSNTTYAILSGITKGAVVQSLFYSFNLTNLSGLQTYLNSLGIGTFIVTNPSGQNVHIVSNANPNNLTSLTYKISSTTYIANQSSTAAGYVAVTANYVVQQIINYLCGITDNQLVTSQDYSICYVDPVSKTKTTIDVPAGTKLSVFIGELVTNGCNTVDYITSLGAVTCASIQAAFPSSIALMTATDIILGTKAGQCARMGPVELGTAILTLGSFNQEFVNAFCALVEQCGSGLSCAPYNLFQVTVVPFSNTCPMISDFVYSFSGTTFNINQFIFGNTPTATQTGTVEYRVHGSGSYTLLSNTISIATDGTPTPTPSIVMSAGISYDIRVSNNCSSPVAYFIKTVTAPGTPPVTTGVEINNSSIDVSVTNVTVNGVEITGVTFPVNAGGDVFGSTDQIGTFDVVVTLTYVSSGQSVEVSGSNHVVVGCDDITSPGSFTFSSVLVNASYRVIVSVNSVPC